MKSCMQYLACAAFGELREQIQLIGGYLIQTILTHNLRYQTPNKELKISISFLSHIQLFDVIFKTLCLDIADPPDIK